MSLSDLSKYFDVIDISPHGWPVACNITVPNENAFFSFPNWPKAVRPGTGRAASGRGPDEAAARRSGLGEAIELASAGRWPDLIVHRARSQDLPGEVWDRDMLCGFSDVQRADAEAQNTAFDGIDRIPPRAPEILDWVAATGLQGEPIFVPANTVCLTDASNAAFSSTDTNGCAAGESDKTARASALFELIERDAAGRWWYGARARPSLDLEALGPQVSGLVAACHDAGLNPLVVDITSDIEIPCLAAVGVSEQGHVALGFAAAPDYGSAAVNALSEMAQMLLVVRKGLAGAAFRRGLLPWLTEASTDTAPLSRIKRTEIAPPPPPSSIGNRLTEAGVRLAFVRLTRPEFGVPVWRALSPDLCHWKPRFGRARLLEADLRDLEPPMDTPNQVLLRL